MDPDARPQHPEHRVSVGPHRVPPVPLLCDLVSRMKHRLRCRVPGDHVGEAKRSLDHGIQLFPNLDVLPEAILRPARAFGDLRIFDWSELLGAPPFHLDPRMRIARLVSRLVAPDATC